MAAHWACSGWKHHWLQGLCWLSHKLPPKLPFLFQWCTLSPAPSSEEVPGMFCYHLHLLSVLLGAEAALFPPLTRSLLRSSSIFAACITRLLFHFLFPNHGVNCAHLFCLVLFYPFQKFCLFTPHSQLLPLPPKILCLFCLIEIELMLPIAPSTLWSYTFPCYTPCCL